MNVMLQAFEGRLKLISVNADVVKETGELRLTLHDQATDKSFTTYNKLPVVRDLYSILMDFANQETDSEHTTNGN